MDRVLIVGAGQAAVATAEALRAGGHAGTITLLGDEPHGPYHRPPLSKGWLAGVTRFVNDILLSAPSILVGVFVYELVVVPTRTFSGWAGGLALAVLVVSIVTRTTESALRLVPVGLREAGAALGATRWRVSTQIVWRAARSGLLTGALLAVARISGETAPLLFTALNNQFWSLDLAQPMANLPVVVFQYAMSPYDDWQRLAWAGSLLVAGAVLLLNVVARAMAGGTGRRSR